MNTIDRANRCAAFAAQFGLNFYQVVTTDGGVFFAAAKNEAGVLHLAREQGVEVEEITLLKKIIQLGEAIPFKGAEHGT